VCGSTGSSAAPGPARGWSSHRALRTTGGTPATTPPGSSSRSTLAVGSKP
jgi:hypothetical protein